MRALAMSMLMFAGVAYAGVFGTLIMSQPTTSIGGQLVMRCVYSVNGQQAAVIVQGSCPLTMYFN